MIIPNFDFDNMDLEHPSIDIHHQPSQLMLNFSVSFNYDIR